jgi:dihydroorotase
LLIRGGRIVDPSQNLDARRDLRISAGLITELAESLEPFPGEPVVDASNAVVAPGFIDMHVHLRDPGFPEKETMESGTLAAVRGGFTDVACMPNTEPPLDTGDRITQLRADAALRAHCHVHPIAALTRARRGVQINDYAALARAGAVGFSDDGSTVMNEGVMREAATAARALDAPFIAHAEPEEAIVERDVRIAREIGKRWHFAHLSTRGSLAILRKAREMAAPVTCEATPHHLIFTSEAVRELGVAAIVNPPLRDSDDAAALRQAVRAGEIDVFASDHAPHTAEDKRGDPQSVSPGFSGLEIAIGAYALALPDLELSQFVAMCSTNPARILHLEGGTLKIGTPADVTVFADRPWRVDANDFASKGRSTPFAGHVLPRRAIATIVGGDLRYGMTA